MLLYESRLKNHIVPVLKCGLVINVCVTALSLRLFFYLILPQSVCRTLEGWQTLITLYDATNSVSVICVASKCFPRERKGIKLPLNYTTHYYMLVLLKKKTVFPVISVLSIATIPIRCCQNSRKVGVSH